MLRRAAPALPTAASPAEAIAAGGFLHYAFPGPSWGRWRAILRAAWGEALNAEDEALFREVAERDPPSRQVRELWAVAGRGGGKDSIASAIAACAALKDYSAFLRPGERATVLCLAADRHQAGIVHGYIGGYFQHDPALRHLVESESDDALELRNGVSIVVGTNSYRAVRGRTIVCAILDEVAFWRDERSTTPDAETYAAILPSLERVQGSMLVGISTPYRRSGLLFDRWRACYGPAGGDDVLVVRGTTRQFNPLVRQETIDAHLARDPETAAAEWLAEWRSDLSDLFDRDLVESAVDAGVVVRPPRAGIEYAAFADASGGRGDSFTLAIAHSEGDVVVLDALYERRAPFSPDDVLAELGSLLRGYAVGRVVGDRYAAEWVPAGFARVGIAYATAEQDRSRLYLDALPLFASGRVRLLDNPRLLHQLCALERRQSRFGRDSISHPSGGHDDVANAAAGALVQIASDARPSLIRQSDLLVADAPLPLPDWCDALFAVLVVSPGWLGAVTYWSWLQRPDGRVPLVLLDLDVRAFSGELIDATIARLEELHRIVRPQQCRDLWCPAALMQSVHLRGFQCQEIDARLLQAGDELALAAASHVGDGAVKIAAPAAEKAEIHPLRGALAVRAGEEVDADPLRLSVLLGIGMALTPTGRVPMPRVPAARILAG